jgi:hypothetical protein
LTALRLYKIDGSELLALASRHKAHISLSANPLQLNVEGIQGELDQLSAHVAQLKSVCVDEYLIYMLILYRIYWRKHFNYSRTNLCVQIFCSEFPGSQVPSYKTLGKRAK